MSQSAAPAPQQPAVVPRQVAAVPPQRDALLPQARASGLPVAAAIVRLNRAREPRAISTSFRSNEACDRAFGFLRPCQTRSPPGSTSIDPRVSGPPTRKSIARVGSAVCEAAHVGATNGNGAGGPPGDAGGRTGSLAVAAIFGPAAKCRDRARGIQERRQALALGVRIVTCTGVDGDQLV